MKTPTDPRHLKRIDIIKDLFAQSFQTQSYISRETSQIIAHISRLDEIIAKSAPQWPLPKVSKVDLAILRLAVYELQIVKKEPPKVIIDEAVELAKEFGGDTSGPFVNGVLGTIMKNIKENKQNS